MISVTKEQYNTFMKSKHIKGTVRYIYDKIVNGTNIVKAYGRTERAPMELISCTSKDKYGVAYYVNQDLYKLSKTEERIK